jgi:DNA processing protein
MILSEKEFPYLLALRSIPQIGNVLCRRLLEHFGSAKAVWKAARSDIKSVRGIPRLCVEHLGNGSLYIKNAESELRKMDARGIRFVTYNDSEYPHRLRECYDAPVLLFYRGSLDALKDPCVGMVGTRRATPYGIEQCQRLVYELASMNPVIVSGLAYGIDITAHRMALRSSMRTVAVLAHGLDRIYPSDHISEVEEMIEAGGAVITEYVMGTLPDQKNFPSRNRIIAGLSDALVVVEAQEKGGALITADIAFGYDRSVYALPGRWGDPSSAGTNALICDQKAQLLMYGKQIIEDMKWSDEGQRHTLKQLDMEFLNPEERVLLELFSSKKEMEFDEIAEELSRKSEEITSLILQLELKGAIRSLGGNRYAII